MTDGVFETEPAVATRRIEPDAWDDIYVVGDVHGCRAELDALLGHLDVTPRDLVVFVGDLVRKGPDSAGVVELVRSRENLLSVRGNNEQKLLDGEDSLAGIGEAELDWMADLPLAITLPDTLIVHGGAGTHKPLGEHDARAFLELRSPPLDSAEERPFWFETRTEGPRVLFGHTVLSEPLHTDWAVGLDTGCVHGRTLSYYDWRADTVGSIPCETTYVERPASKILDPQPPESSPASR